jgi:glycosyltransferase involved in cell wall biosynthesis
VISVAPGNPASDSQSAITDTLVREASGDESRGVPDVTVVIATYNRPDSLLCLLEDLRVQTGLDRDVHSRPSFDVVVVDDGGSAPVLPELATRRYPFALAAVRRRNGGPGAARDTGIRRAMGEIIVILDDDMVIPPKFVAAHLAAHFVGAEVVLGNILPPHVGTLPLFERFHLEGMQRFAAAYRAGRAEVEGTRLCTGNVSFRKAAYNEVGGFDLSLQRCEDRDLGIRLELAGKIFAVADDAWSEHRSDHEDVATWRRRSHLFGELDVRIAQKHPDQHKVSPWAFLPKLPLIVRPFVVMAALLPSMGQRGAGAAYRLGELADTRVFKRFALIGASTCYALEYFAGVGTELGRGGRRRDVVASLRSARRTQRTVEASVNVRGVAT